MTTTTLSICSGLKGGIGKDTITANIGKALALQGHKTLLIDLDKHLAGFFSMQQPSPLTPLSDYITGKITDLKYVLHPTKDIPNLRLTTIDSFSTTIETPENILRDIIKLLEPYFDYILLNLPATESDNMIGFFNMSRRSIYLYNDEQDTLIKGVTFFNLAIKKVLIRYLSLQKNNYNKDIIQYLINSLIETKMFHYQNFLDTLTQIKNKTSINLVDKIIRLLSIYTAKTYGVINPNKNRISPESLIINSLNGSIQAVIGPHKISYGGYLSFAPEIDHAKFSGQCFYKGKLNFSRENLNDIQQQNIYDALSIEIDNIINTVLNSKSL